MSTASEKNLTLGQQCVQFEHLNGLPTKYEKSSRKTIVSLQALLIASWVNQRNVQINVQGLVLGHKMAFKGEGAVV